MVPRLAGLLTITCLGCSGATSGPQATPPPEASGEIDVRAFLLSTAEGALNEEPPFGVPSSWDWASAATPTRVSPPAPQYTHANYWGAIFRGPTNASPAGTVVRVAKCSMWFLRAGAAAWTRANASSSLEGATFTPTYAGGGVPPPFLEGRTDGVAVTPADESIWHFWPSNGYQRMESAVLEILVNCQARLERRAADVRDDRSDADYLLHVGADFRDPDDPSCAADQSICPSWGVGRLERVRSAWSNYAFHSLTKADLLDGIALPGAEVFRLPSEP